MRYYDCTITNPDGSIFRRWASHTKGVFDPAAQNVEFDIITTLYSTPSGAQSFEIEGVALTDLGNASEFAPQYENTGALDPSKQKTFTLMAGMQKGLPLANPLQIGRITRGTIFQSFGNWQGTEMALNLVIVPSVYSYDNPGNIVLHWKNGTTLESALRNALSIPYPAKDYPLSINISPTFVATADVVHKSASLEDLAQTVQTLTEGKLSPNDPGVMISLQNGLLNVYDSTYKPKVIQLSFTDLVGQPTWIASKTIIFKLVMRGDISLGSLVQLPAKMQNAPGMALTSAEAYPSSMKYKTLFNGVFRVNAVRHIGNYRSADGAAWVTVLQCVPL